MKSHIAHFLKGHGTVEEGFLALVTSKKHVNFFNIKLNNLKPLMIRKIFLLRGNVTLQGVIMTGLYIVDVLIIDTVLNYVG